MEMTCPNLCNNASTNVGAGNGLDPAAPWNLSDVTPMVRTEDGKGMLVNGVAYYPTGKLTQFFGPSTHHSSNWRSSPLDGISRARTAIPKNNDIWNIVLEASNPFCLA